MALKIAVFAAVLAVANAGYLGGYAAPAVAYGAPAYAAYGAHAVAPAAITSQQSNILRSYGNLGQVSTYSKTVDTPYSSVSKSDVRVSNDAVAHVAAPAYATYAAHAAPVAYAAHAAPVAYAAPAVHAAPAVVKAAAPAVGLLGVAYSAAPAVAHMTYSAPALSYTW